jgi:hypothetical protein
MPAKESSTLIIIIIYIAFLSGALLHKQQMIKGAFWLKTETGKS